MDRKKNLIVLMLPSVISRDLVVVIPRASERTDITELRTRSELVNICSVYILKPAGVTRISEQVRIDNVL